MDHSQAIAAAFARHERIAFQFSGGRDSLCALFMLRPYWARMTVYHLATGDDFPETQAIVANVAAAVPRFVQVDGYSRQTREAFGLSTDLMPANATRMGFVQSGTPVPMIHRYDCCARSIMLPMWQRMQADGITLIVRGQRAEDLANPPARSGAVDGGIELLFPIEGWTTEQVMLALDAMDVPVPRFYAEGMDKAPECMTCTAWWNERRGAYLAKYHREQHRLYQQHMGVIAAALRPYVDQLDSELGQG